jgi:3-hydroxyacyl-CoA dehydrogenase
MKKQIHSAVVIGAGTMGASIAAHLANAQVDVVLLDILPRELNDKEKKIGLTLEDKIVRNRIAQNGLDAAKKSRPASFFSKRQIDRVKIGNLEDDIALVANADWVIEVIIENLDIKRKLMETIDTLRGVTTIISTNTSGIPISEIAKGRSEGFRKNFLGTHFFNPPRYLKLLELIPSPDTDADVIETISEFGERRLGKGIVLCKDTPNFIANRIASVTGAFALNFALEHGYTIPEIDSISGPLIGRPKTAVFRLMDLVGVDVAEHVRANLAELIPDDAIALNALNSEKTNNLSLEMVKRGWHGNKTKIGYYKTVRVDGKKEFWPLNLQSMEHEPAGDKPRFESVGKAKGIESFGERLNTLFSGDDKASKYLSATTYFSLSYASQMVPEVAELPSSIDDAVRWGFMHDDGPFRIWDQIGVKETCNSMKASGYSPADWVTDMLENGFETFYQYKSGNPIAIYSPDSKSYIKFDPPTNRISLPTLKISGGIVKENDGATIIDIGDGIATVEFHTKMNTLDEDIITMVNTSMDLVETNFDGLVIGNDADIFSAGANLFFVAMAAQSEQWDDLELAVRTLQELHTRMRFFPKPIVVAPAGLALGGGCEITLHASRVVAAAETYIGLVEVGAGVIPAGGGTKEMMRRILNLPMRTDHTDALPYLEKLFIQLGQAKVATSGEEARQMGIFAPGDRIIMNRDHLLFEAKREARHLFDSGYTAPAPEKIYAAGRDALAALRIGIRQFVEGGYISEYDAVVGEKLAYVLCGGELSKPTWVSEQYILDLEREAFLSLCGEEKTQKRIWHILQTGKPLRN